MNLLDKVYDLEEDAANFGFRWETTAQIMAQIQSECVEINEHLQQESELINQAELQEEIGDLIHAAFSLAVFCKFNPRDTLKLTLDKFERRIDAVKTIAKEQGYTTLDGLPFERLMGIWDLAKQRSL